MPQIMRLLWESAKAFNVWLNLKALSKITEVSSLHIVEQMHRERTALMKRRLDLVIEKRNLENMITELTRNINRLEFDQKRDTLEEAPKEQTMEASKSEQQDNKQIKSESKQDP